MARRNIRFDSDVGPARKTKIDPAIHAIRLAIIKFFDERYGKDIERIEGWQELCRDVGVEVAASITKCKENLRGVYINIVDFWEAVLKQNPVYTFESWEALRDYIIMHPDKKFPLKKAKRNLFLKWMLIDLDENLDDEKKPNKSGNACSGKFADETRDESEAVEEGEAVEDAKAVDEVTAVEEFKDVEEVKVVDKVKVVEGVKDVDEVGGVGKGKGLTNIKGVEYLARALRQCRISVA